MRYTIAGINGALVCALLAGCGGSGSSGGGGGRTATITGVSVTVAPTAITTTQTATATATVTGTGDFSSAVSWSVSPSSAGTITSTGVFTPSTAGTASIIATSTEDSTKSGNASLTTISITISPGSPTVTIGASQQFTATVAGTTNTAVDWSLTAPSGWTGDVGTISSSGLYQTPYPAPPTVTLTATSAAYPLYESTTVTLAPPATANGPALTVDTANELHPISPLIYGMNAYVLDTTSAQTANVSVTRWGGDNTSQYNYQTGNSNSAGDYYFENGSGAGGMLPNPNGSSQFTAYVSAASALPATVLGTMNVMGYVANSNTTACGFPESSFPNQASYVTLGNNSCGDGYYQVGSNGCTTSSGNYDSSIPGCSFSGTSTTWQNTSLQEPPPSAPGAGNNTKSWATGTWPGGWVNSIVTASGFGNGASGKGVAIWDMDNEPAWWDAVHRDVHPNPSTYDEVTNGGIGTAVAIKTVDPTALVSGPIIDFWWNYFYSKADIESGWGSGSPCYEPWSNPTDREAHNGVAMIPYYLEQMNKASSIYGMRLLDYLDIHGYFANDATGNGLGLTAAGDTAEQAARMDSVRALWDPTYQNVNYPQPNYTTDSNYTTSCNTPLQSPQAIPMLHAWVNGTAPLGDPKNDYPGTKTAIDEYNFGGLESINGAVTQADVLGVFGQYGLDLATLWPTTNYSMQGPGNMAFAIYRNYNLENNNAVFGNMALASCSTTNPLAGACTPIDANLQPVANMETGQGELSVYGALRTSDNMITVVVINKTFGALTSTLSLADLNIQAAASVFQYSNANLTAIVEQQNDANVAPPTGSSNASTLTYTFPAQSITLFVIPQ